MSETMFEVVLGSYEEFLLGYKFSSKNSKITQTFASHDHSSSIRCVAICGNLMASGGADDRICIYDLKTRQEHCMLTHHNSTVTCLAFTPGRSHLISGTADGCISVVRVGNWQLEKVWEKAHKGAAILDIVVHETGKLALSLAADCTLKTWNLVKGRQAYTVNLNSKCKDPKSLTHIQWAPDGVKFVLSGGKYTEIFSIHTGGVLLSVEHKNKIASSVWLSDEELLVGYENGQLGILSTEDGSIEIKDAHSSRVKAISKYEDWIVTACSSGEFKVWDASLEELARFDTGCRLTCLSVIPQMEVKKKESEGTEEIEEGGCLSEDDKSDQEIGKRAEVVIVEEEDDDADCKVERNKKYKKKRKTQLSNEENTESVVNEKKFKKKNKRNVAKDVEETGGSVAAKKKKGR